MIDASCRGSKRIEEKRNNQRRRPPSPESAFGERRVAIGSPTSDNGVAADGGTARARDLFPI